MQSYQYFTKFSIVDDTFLKNSKSNRDKYVGEYIADKKNGKLHKSY